MLDSYNLLAAARAALALADAIENKTAPDSLARFNTKSSILDAVECLHTYSQDGPYFLVHPGSGFLDESPDAVALRSLFQPLAKTANTNEHSSNTQES
jgi:hypothetical protein